MEGIWGILVIVGPLLLIGAIIYATMRTRNAGAASERKAEEGARRLQEDIERDQVRD